MTSPWWTKVSPGGACVVLNFMDNALETHKYRKRIRQRLCTNVPIPKIKLRLAELGTNTHCKIFPIFIRYYFTRNSKLLILRLNCKFGAFLNRLTAVNLFVNKLEKRAGNSNSILAKFQIHFRGKLDKNMSFFVTVWNVRAWATSRKLSRVT